MGWGEEDEEKKASGDLDVPAAIAQGDQVGEEWEMGKEKQFIYVQGRVNFQMKGWCGSIVWLQFIGPAWPREQENLTN